MSTDATPAGPRRVRLLLGILAATGLAATAYWLVGDHGAPPAPPASSAAAPASGGLAGLRERLAPAASGLAPSVAPGAPAALPPRPAVAAPGTTPAPRGSTPALPGAVGETPPAAEAPRPLGGTLPPVAGLAAPEAEGAEDPEEEARLVYAPDREGIQGAIRAEREALRECYAAWLAASPKLGGTAKLTFVIADPGEGGDERLARVTEVTLAHSALTEAPGRAALEGCLLNVLSSLRFDPPEGGRLQVSYPFQFAAEAPPAPAP